MHWVVDRSPKQAVAQRHSGSKMGPRQWAMFSQARYNPFRIANRPPMATMHGWMAESRHCQRPTECHTARPRVNRAVVFHCSPRCSATVDVQQHMTVPRQSSTEQGDKHHATHAIDNTCGRL